MMALSLLIHARECVQWRRNRGFRRFNEPGPPSSWGPRVVGPQENFRQENNKPTSGKTNNKLQSA